jgi:chemotaxis protein CheC
MSNQPLEPKANRRIDIEKLGVLNQLGEVGVAGVESRLGKLADRPTAVESELVKNGYVEVDTLEMKFDPAKRLGVEVSLNGAPHGSVLVLFPPSSANRAVKLMLEDMVTDVSEIENDMAVSALVELGGIMAYGFLDALADTFDQHIDAGPPVARNSTIRAAVKSVLTDEEDRGLYLSTAFRVTSHDIDAEVYLFPENETFVKVLNLVDIDMVRNETER